MKLCKRTRTGFLQRVEVQKFAYMTVMSWGYWMIIFENKKAKK